MKRTSIVESLASLFIILMVANFSIAQDTTVSGQHNLSMQEREYIRHLNEQLDQGRLPPPVISVAENPNERHSFSCDGSPLYMTLDYYSKISGVKFENPNEHTANITYHSHRQLSADEILRIITKLLSDKGIRLTKIDNTTLKVSGTLSPTTETAQSEFTSDYNMKVRRRGKRPPIPIPRVE